MKRVVTVVVVVAAGIAFAGFVMGRAYELDVQRKASTGESEDPWRRPTRIVEVVAADMKPALLVECDMQSDCYRLAIERCPGGYVSVGYEHARLGLFTDLIRCR